MHLVWSVLADHDLVHTIEYIEQDNPDASARIEQRIYEAVEILNDFPEIGRKGKMHGTRELVISGTPYIAVYRIDADTIRILRLLHGAQMWPEDFTHL